MKIQAMKILAVLLVFAAIASGDMSQTWDEYTAELDEVLEKIEAQKEAGEEPDLTELHKLLPSKEDIAVTSEGIARMHKEALRDISDKRRSSEKTGRYIGYAIGGGLILALWTIVAKKKQPEMVKRECDSCGEQDHAISESRSRRSKRSEWMAGIALICVVVFLIIRFAIL